MLTTKFQAMARTTRLGLTRNR